MVTAWISISLDIDKVCLVAYHGSQISTSMQQARKALFACVWHHKSSTICAAGGTTDKGIGIQACGVYNALIGIDWLARRARLIAAFLQDLSPPG
jgi:hypothetical protein